MFKREDMMSGKLLIEVTTALNGIARSYSPEKIFSQQQLSAMSYSHHSPLELIRFRVQSLSVFRYVVKFCDETKHVLNHAIQKQSK